MSSTNSSYSSASSLPIDIEENAVVGTYTVVGLLGKGGYGTVYHGRCNVTAADVAIKFENVRHDCLGHEHEVYEELEGGVGIPRVYWYGQDGANNVLVMDRLGRSLEDILKTLPGKKFSLKTTLMLADQMLKRIEYVHDKDFVHRDIKPENFAVGFAETKNVVYLLDFGCTEMYRRYDGKQHVGFSMTHEWVGTLSFISRSSHCGVDVSRRDDIESFAYCLLYMLRGNLPWDDEDDSKKVARQKESVKPKTICAGFPKEIEVVYDYCRKLQYSEKPDYEYVRTTLSSLFASKGYVYDNHFDWVPPRSDAGFCEACKSMCNYFGLGWNPILVPE